ncbi:hypothetical protein GW17_00002719, partial [Ensete ventricosum]
QVNESGFDVVASYILITCVQTPTEKKVGEEQTFPALGREREKKKKKKKKGKMIPPGIAAASSSSSASFYDICTYAAGIAGELSRLLYLSAVSFDLLLQAMLSPSSCLCHQCEFIDISTLSISLLIVQNKSTEEFSGLPYIYSLLNCLICMWYGLPCVSYGVILVATVNSIAIDACSSLTAVLQLPNGIGTVLAVIQLLLYAYYSINSREDSNLPLLVS